MDRFERATRRKALKQRAIDLMGGSCRICGYDRCVSALEFHHPDAMDKDFTISTRTSWKAIQVELRKCVLLCSNCHREVHEGLHAGFLVQPEDFRGTDWDEDALEPEQLTLV